MFLLKQFLKHIILPPMAWMLPLLIVLVCWRRQWARRLLFFTVCAILLLHSGFIDRLTRYPLESRYPPLLNPQQSGPYDAIIVLTAGSIPANGLVPFPAVNEAMFRRLEEAWRLFKIQPKPIVVSGGHVNPFTPAEDENKTARDYLIRWGVPKDHVLDEAQSRDTFESSLEIAKLMKQKGWRRYLLVTSATHMPRSMLAFSTNAPEPIPAPGDFTLIESSWTPLDVFPTSSAAQNIAASLHEYLGWINYYWRLSFTAAR